MLNAYVQSSYRHNRHVQEAEVLVKGTTKSNEEKIYRLERGEGPTQIERIVKNPHHTTSLPPKTWQ